MRNLSRSPIASCKENIVSPIPPLHCDMVETSDYTGGRQGKQGGLATDFEKEAQIDNKNTIWDGGSTAQIKGFLGLTDWTIEMRLGLNCV